MSSWTPTKAEHEYLIGVGTNARQHQQHRIFEGKPTIYEELFKRRRAELDQATRTGVGYANAYNAYKHAQQFVKNSKPSNKPELRSTRGATSRTSRRKALRKTRVNRKRRTMRK